jgi:hypothetical protein
MKEIINSRQLTYLMNEFNIEQLDREDGGFFILLGYGSTSSVLIRTSYCPDEGLNWGPEKDQRAVIIWASESVLARIRGMK